MRVLAVAAGVSGALGCGRIGFDPGAGDPVCPTSPCDLGPWMPLGNGHGTDSGTRLVWSSTTGGGVGGEVEAWVGVEGGTGRAIDRAFMTVDAGVPTVALIDGRDRLTIRTFDGTEFVDAFAPIGFPNASFRSPVYAVDADGDPVYAAIDDTGEVPTLNVARWTGTGWTRLPGVQATGGPIGLGVGPGDAPFAAWIEAGAVWVRRYDGNAWVEMGAGSATGAGLGDPGRTATDVGALGGDKPIVYWTDRRSGNDQLFLRMWDGAGFVELDGSATTPISGGAIGVITPRVVRTPTSIVAAWSGSTGGSRQVYARRHTGGGAWTEIGPGSDTGGGLSAASADVTLRSLAAGGERVAVAWTSSSAPGQIRTWTGTAWTPAVAEPLAGFAESLVVGIDDAGAICAVEEVNGVVHLVCDTGTGWRALGPDTPAQPSISASPGHSAFPTLAAAAAGGGFEAAWMDQVATSSRHAYARSLIDGAWIERTPGTASGSGIAGFGDTARATVTAGARPAVFWVAYSACLMVRMWTGASWDEAPAGSADEAGCGIIPDDAADVRTPSAALDANGDPWVAFQDHCVDWNIYVMRFTGSGWAFVGPPVCETRGASDLDLAETPRLVFDATGRAVLAYTGRAVPGAPYEVYVRAWDGVAWQDLAGSGTGGGVSASGGNAFRPAVAVDPSGMIWLAWADSSSGSDQIYVRMFDGAAWREVDGSASGGGISAATGGGATTPSIAIDRHGRPVVAWSDRSSGDWEIYVRRWNGADWLEVSGSATGGGMSNSNGPSLNPSLAIAGDLACVAWSEPDRDASDIRARCLTLAR
jgi:hypothetical protein